MKSFINKIVTKLQRFNIRRKFLNKEIAKIMSEAKISNAKLPKEDIWFKKWSKLLSDTDRKYYRIYNKYIGEDINIMPDDVCHMIVEPILNPPKYRHFYSDKNMFDRVLRLKFDKPVTPQTYIRNINGIYYDIDYNKLNKEDICFSELCDCNRIVVKPSVGSSSGKGVLFFEKSGNKFIGGEDGEQELSISFLDKIYKENYVIQKAVRQSAYISQFSSTSVNTLRIQVYRSVKTGEVHVLNMIIRIGKEGSLLDNAHAGGCFVGIDINSGKLDNKVLNQYGVQFDTFNNIDFKNNTYIIPNFENVKKFAQKVGECITHQNIIALDVILDENNQPMLIEYNIDAFGLWAFQFTGNTAFGDFTDEVIEYCVKNMNKANTAHI